LENNENIEKIKRIEKIQNSEKIEKFENIEINGQLNIIIIILLLDYLC